LDTTRKYPENFGSTGINLDNGKRLGIDTFGKTAASRIAQRQDTRRKERNIRIDRNFDMIASRLSERKSPDLGNSAWDNYEFVVSHAEWRVVAGAHVS
jgi:hypothetical protein